MANVMYGLTKMRFKQSTGDPSGSKHFLSCENTKPGTVIGYVGNRFNVLLFSAENCFKIKEKLLYYLQKMCYCKNSLKSSLINDLQNIRVLQCSK